MMMSEWLTPTPPHIADPLGGIKNMKYNGTYKSLELQKVKIEDVSIGLRQIGKGEK